MEEHQDKNKKRFEVKMRSDGQGGIEKAVFIDGEILDWSIDVESYLKMVRLGPVYAKQAQDDISKHFVESVSDFLKRRVTIQDIENATRTGWI